MAFERQSIKRWTWMIFGLSLVTLGPGLSATLSYHEAIVAQGAREMLADQSVLIPTLNGQPWLEKPPLLHWLVMISASLFGGVSEFSARIPSVFATFGISLAVFTIARRRCGVTVGGLAGCIQTTMIWSVVRGRLAESDIVLACLIAWIIVGVDYVRQFDSRSKRVIRWIWLGIGMTSLLKGIGFGIALLGVIFLLVMIWDRDWQRLRLFLDPVALALGLLAVSVWPLLVLARYPEVLGLWTVHVADRFAERPTMFAGQSVWWAYLPVILTSTIPWMPLYFLAVRSSIKRARSTSLGLDRLLLCWAIGPVVLLSFASVKNPHYLIHALAPWSIWAAMGMMRVYQWRLVQGRSEFKLKTLARISFVGLAIMLGLGVGVVAPNFDRRSSEWLFYEKASHQIPVNETVILLYDDWDRLPYPTPFGPVPHDLAIRLFYLQREVHWREGVDHWENLPESSFLTIARDRDFEGLTRIGKVRKIVQGPTLRWDRSFALFRVSPEVKLSSNHRVQE
jgi:4-amino-4-deoxy-L-arabinose transferase-like glycosyltransferase